MKKEEEKTKMKIVKNKNQTRKISTNRTIRDMEESKRRKKEKGIRREISASIKNTRNIVRVKFTQFAINIYLALRASSVKLTNNHQLSIQSLKCNEYDFLFFSYDNYVCLWKNC